MPQLEAAKQGYAQNLWLHGPEHYLTEVSHAEAYIDFVVPNLIRTLGQPRSER